MLLPIIGLAGNLIGFASGVYSLSTLERRDGGVISTIHALASAVDILGHSGNILGYSQSLSDLPKEEDPQVPENSWHGAKLLALNSGSLAFHIANVLFIERQGFAALFNLYDRAEILSHAHDIYTNARALGQQTSEG